MGKLTAVLRFLAGILIVQAATVALVVASSLAVGNWEPWWPVLTALSVVALLAAFWFSALAGHLGREQVDRLRAEFSRERENLRVRAERDKTRIVRQSHRTIEKQTRRTEAKANVKVGAAFTAAAGFGLLMVLTNFVNLGLLSMVGAASALGGYLMHRNRTARADPSLPSVGNGTWRKRLPGRNTPK